MQGSMYATATTNPSLDTVLLYVPLTISWTEAAPHSSFADRSPISTYQLGNVDSLYSGTGEAFPSLCLTFSALEGY